MKKRMACIFLLFGLVFIGGGFLLSHHEKKVIPQEKEQPKEQEKEEVNLGIYEKIDTRFEIVDNVNENDIVKYYIQNHSNEEQPIQNIVITLCDKNMETIERIEKEVNQPCPAGEELMFTFPFQTDFSQVEDYKITASLNDGVES